VDVHDVYEHELNNDDPDFENALCDCIQESLKHRQYFTVGSVCGSWARDMWDCAKKKYWAKKGQPWRAFPSPETALSWAY
jgi:hypothetical protein